MRFFSIFLAIVFIFTYMQATSGSLVGSLVGVDADVLSKKGESECGKGKGDGKGSCKESSKGGLVDVDLDVLSSS